MAPISGFRPEPLDTVRHTSLRLPRRRVVCVKKKRNISGLFSQLVIRQEIAHRRPSLMIVYSSRGHAIDVPQITDSVPGPLRPLRGNARYKYFATYTVGKGNFPSASPDRKSADLGRPRSFPIGVALRQYCNTNNVSNKIIWGAFVLTGELDSDAGLNWAKDPHAIQPLQIEASPQ